MLVDQNGLERDLSALLLRTLAVGRRQKIDSIEVSCSRYYGVRRFDEPFRHWSPLLVEPHITFCRDLNPCWSEWRVVTMM